MRNLKLKTKNSLKKRNKRIERVENYFGKIEVTLGKMREDYQKIIARLDEQKEFNAEQKEFNQKQRKVNEDVDAMLHI